jgi:hypothetical protein
MEKNIQYSLILLYGIFAFLGCKKESSRLPVGTPPKLRTTFVEVVDHTTGESVGGQELLIGRYNEVISSPGNFTAVESRDTDPAGSIRYLQSLRPIFFRPGGEIYSDIVYVVEGTEPYKNEGLPFKKCRFLKNESGISLYRTELYRNAPVDIHLKQVSEHFNSPIKDGKMQLTFNGYDPNDPASTYYLRKEFIKGVDLLITPGTKIDTVFRVYAFGDLENTINWSILVYAPSPLDYTDIVEYNYNGEIKMKKYPSPIPTSINITF